MFSVEGLHSSVACPKLNWQPKSNNMMMVLINPPLLVLVLLFDFQALVQSHRRARLEV
jgi:hypothetical protein